MQRRVVAIFFVVGLLMLASAIPAFAGTSEFTGTLTHDDPFIDGAVADSDSCDDPYFPDLGFHYHVYDFYAPISGEYVYENSWYYEPAGPVVQGAGPRGERSFGGVSKTAAPAGTLIDLVIQVYQDGMFDPEDSLANCLGAADDYRVFNLAAGNYDIVVLTYWEDDAGDYYFTITGPDPAACTNPLPDGSAVYSIPAGAPAFYEASLDAALGFNVPAGTWNISEWSGDFAKVWIACQAESVWVPANAVAH